MAQNRQLSFVMALPEWSEMYDSTHALQSQRAATDSRLSFGFWCDDPTFDQGRARLELRTNGGALVAAHETRGLRHVSWRVQIAPRSEGEQWFFVCVHYGDGALAYSSPLWAHWD